jgi:hypothetical protein
VTVTRPAGLSMGGQATRISIHVRENHGKGVKTVREREGRGLDNVDFRPRTATEGNKPLFSGAIINFDDMLSTP